MFGHQLDVLSTIPFCSSERERERKKKRREKSVWDSPTLLRRIPDLHGTDPGGDSGASCMFLRSLDERLEHKYSSEVTSKLLHEVSDEVLLQTMRIAIKSRRLVLSFYDRFISHMKDSVSAENLTRH